MDQNHNILGTWNAQICDALRPEPQDEVIIGKHGLSAFPNTDLEEKLKSHGIETLALAGFMANCCVESTMREACDKGFNVITLIDCVATTSMAGKVFFEDRSGTIRWEILNFLGEQ